MLRLVGVDVAFLSQHGSQLRARGEGTWEESSGRGRGVESWDKCAIVTAA